MMENETVLEYSIETPVKTVYPFDKQIAHYVIHSKMKFNSILSPRTTRQFLCIFMCWAILGQGAIGINALTDKTFMGAAVNDISKGSIQGNINSDRLTHPASNQKIHIDRTDGIRADKMYRILTEGHRRTQGSSHLEIVTQFDGLTGTFGIMFDIESRSVDYNVESLDIHSNDNDNYSLNPDGTPCNVLVYTREGSHVGHEANIGSWELLVDEEILCMNFGQRTIIPPDLFLRADGSKIKVEAGKTRAFYVTMKDKPVLRYTKGDELGAVHVQDDYVIIKQGTGIGGFYDSSKLYKPRLFNGVINYSLEENVNVTNNIQSNIPLPQLVSNNHNQMPDDFALDGCPMETSSDFLDNLGSYGNMFDILAPKEDISLYSMDLYTDLKKEVFYEIYTKRGRFFENDGLKTLYAWTKLGSGSFYGKGKGIGVKVPYMSPIVVPQGIAQGFYVTFTTADMRYKNVTDISDTDGKVLQLGEKYIEDDYLVIEAGVGVGAYPLDASVEFFSTRLFIGKFRYLISSSCKTEHPTPFPTLFPTPFPPLKPHTSSPTGECISNYYIVTALDGKSVADGTMFDVRALNDLTITTFEVKTLPLNVISHDAKLFIFTKTGSYSGYEDNSSAWTKICEVKFSSTTQNPDGNTLIPQGTCKEINLEKYQVKSFYIASSDTAIIYSSGTEVGTPILDHDNILIMQGSGLIGDKLFFSKQKFEPRVFNGVIHVRQDVNCPTARPTSLSPTSSPTFFPTIDPYTEFTETTVIFNFNLEHSLYMTAKEIFDEVNSSTSKTIQGLIENEDLFIIWRIHQGLDFVSASTIFGDQLDVKESCSAKETDRICTKVDTLITMKHFKNLDAGELTFHLLRKSDELTINLGLGSFNTIFIGEKTLLTRQIITLTGIPSKNMGESETKYFEKVSKQYLDELMKIQNEVDILTVEVADQNLRIEESRTLRESGRLLQSTSTSIEITTIVTGKHQPPPEINFSVLVSDALNEGNEEYVQKLKLPPSSNSETDEQAELSYFQHVKSVFASPVPMSSLSPSPTVEEINQSISLQKGGIPYDSKSTFDLVGISCGVIGGIIVIGFVIYWLKTRKNYFKVLNKLPGASTQRKNISDNKHSRFLYRPKSQTSNADLFESLKVRKDDIDTKIFPIDEEDHDDHFFQTFMKRKSNVKNDDQNSCAHNDSNRTCSTVDIENDRSSSSLNLDDFENPRRSSTKRSNSESKDISQNLRSSRGKKSFHERNHDSYVKKVKSSRRSASNEGNNYNGSHSMGLGQNSSFVKSRYKEDIESSYGTSRRGHDP